MADLSSLHITNEFEGLEIELSSRELTPQESARQWLVLQRAFEGQLKETDALFAQERREALIDLQLRLKRLEEWQAAHG